VVSVVVAVIKDIAETLAAGAIEDDPRAEGGEDEEGHEVVEGRVAVEKEVK